MNIVVGNFTVFVFDRVILSVAGVYFIAAVISYLLSKGEADEMTNALKNFGDEG